MSAYKKFKLAQQVKNEPSAESFLCETETVDDKRRNFSNIIQGGEGGEKTHYEPSVRRRAGVADSRGLRTSCTAWICDGESKRYDASSKTRPFRHSDAVGVTAVGCLLSEHLGIGGHVKFTVRTRNFGRGSGRRGMRTGLMTFKDRIEWGNPYS
ncbi:hypothetical protein EVAR_78603_1 [Eumeta japonica]|uniref:Uncharacterized protein n=1 Tax=Eumeta variegata TaxID=151549 RepID=A0A4C1U8I9_EUMVA|nr:hypothetical protein EVAR_78603_1 [Eumeta japonica]